MVRPLRRAFHLTPLLRAVRQPPAAHASHVLYAGPSREGSCEVEPTVRTLAHGHLVPLRLGDLPQDLPRWMGREPGWTWPGAYVAGPDWASCDDLFGRGQGRYAGPRLLAGVVYDVGADVPEWRYEHVYEPPPGEGLADDRGPLWWVRLKDVIELGDPGWPWVHNEFDSENRVVSHGIAGSGAIRYAYDRSDPTLDLTEVTTRDGRIVHYAYERSTGLLAHRSDGPPGGERWTAYEYRPGRDTTWAGRFAAGRLGVKHLPGGRSIEYRYPDHGQEQGFLLLDEQEGLFPTLVELHFPTRVVTIGSDGEELVDNPLSHAWDDNGHFYQLRMVNSSTDGLPAKPGGVVYWYDYDLEVLNPCNGEDPQGSLVRADYPDGTFEAWTHDRFGRVLEHRTRDGRVDAYEYRPFDNEDDNCAVYGVLARYEPEDRP